MLNEAIKQQEEALRHCASIEELQGVASENQNFKTATAILDDLAVEVAVKLDPITGIEAIAPVVGEKAKTLREKRNILKKYGLELLI